MPTDGRIVNAVLRVLEPCEAKVSRTVLRGERERNLPDLLGTKRLGASVRNQTER